MVSGRTCKLCTGLALMLNSLMWGSSAHRCSGCTTRKRLSGYNKTETCEISKVPFTWPHSEWNCFLCIFLRPAPPPWKSFTFTQQHLKTLFPRHPEKILQTRTEHVRPHECAVFCLFHWKHTHAAEHIHNKHSRLHKCSSGHTTSVDCWLSK